MEIQCCLMMTEQRDDGHVMVKKLLREPLWNNTIYSSLPDLRN
jgi:hypothetical protein